MRRSILPILALGALAACAPMRERLGWGERAPAALPAPGTTGAALIIDATDAGKTVDAAVGSAVAVTLIGIPTAGYVWKPAAAPDFVAALGETSGPTSAAQREPGFTGGSHWEVFTYRVEAAGEGELRFEQRRPWESASEPANAGFTVTLRAR